ncbi:MAG: hypothetical protein ACK5LX_06140 [Oscillospiraceae bacterium]
MLWKILSVILGILFVGVAIYLLISFAALALSAKILWLAVIIFLAAILIMLIRKAVQKA